MNVIFFPMLIQGLAGVNRRLWDGGAAYQLAEPVLFLNARCRTRRSLLGFFQLFFIVNLFMSIRRGRAANANPWQATTLEWATPTPPLAHGNFAHAAARLPGSLRVQRAGARADFLPQHVRTTRSMNAKVKIQNANRM